MDDVLRVESTHISGVNLRRDLGVTGRDMDEIDSSPRPAVAPWMPCVYSERMVSRQRHNTWAHLGNTTDIRRVGVVGPWDYSRPP